MSESKCRRCHGEGCQKWGLQCLKGPNCDPLDIVKTYGDTGPSAPTIYGVFIMFTEDEGNIIFDFAGLADNLLNAKNMVNQLLIKFVVVNVLTTHDMINKDNNFTFIGKRTELNQYSKKGFRTCNGFVIEKLSYNQICNVY